MKDQLQGQIFFAVMYRKQILWDDLDIGGKEGEAVYASPKVVEIHEKMTAYQQEWGYKPTKMVYEPITENKPGLYTRAKADDFKPETSETLKDMVGSCIEMETLIQQKFLFSEEKRRQFFDSNPVQ